jgi:hypothetical protein
VQFWQLLSLLTVKRWVWKAAIAGFCGNITHTFLMLGKAKLGILESFQPYKVSRSRSVTQPVRISIR